MKRLITSILSLVLLILLFGLFYDQQVFAGETSPVPNPGLNRSTFIGIKVNLDGSQSTGGQGISLSYKWRLSSKPEGSQSLLVNEQTETPYFIPDKAGNYTVALSVYDGAITSEEQQVTITAKEFNDISDNVNYNLIGDLNTNYLAGYSFLDMVSLADGWVIIGDITKNKVIILNVITGEIGKEYQLISSPQKIDFDFDKGIILVPSSKQIRLQRWM